MQDGNSWEHGTKRGLFHGDSSLLPGVSFWTAVQGGETQTEVDSLHIWGERDDWRYKSEVIEVLDFVCQRTGEEEAARKEHSRILQGSPLKSMAEY